MEKEASNLSAYLAHVLLVFAQAYCGFFLVAFLGPMFVFLFSSPVTVEALLSSFPRFWAFGPKDLGGVVVVAVISYPLGLVAAEFFYRTGRFLRYHNDLNLESDKLDATDEDRVEVFRQNCLIQKSVVYSKVWEWENFQSATFYYAEWIGLTFTLLYTISIAVAVVSSPSPSPTGVRTWVLAILIWLGAGLFFGVMRSARISKYQSFRFANRAIKDLLQAENDTSRPPAIDVAGDGALWDRQETSTTRSGRQPTAFQKMLRALPRVFRPSRGS